MQSKSKNSPNALNSATIDKFNDPMYGKNNERYGQKSLNIALRWIQFECGCLKIRRIYTEC